MSDAFVLDPIDAKEELKLPFEDDIYKLCGRLFYDENLRQMTKKPSLGSRHAGKIYVILFSLFSKVQYSLMSFIPHNK